jgi:hypothetical protein
MTDKKEQSDSVRPHAFRINRKKENIKDAKQGVTKRSRQSWLTKSALVYEPKCGRGGGGGLRLGLSSDNEYSCAHGAQIKFGDLTPYLTYDAK